jgi:serine/threonine-protein kinase
VKIIDFGAASWELAARGSARPSPPRDLSYAAPEVPQGLDLERPSDVYSLGAVLHEICSTALPPASSAWPRRRGAVQPGEPGLDDLLPEGLGAVLDRALRHAPHERFATAADFAEALDDVAAHHRWRTTPAHIGEYLAQTFATGAHAARPYRRPPSETSTTRVRLRRTGN